MPATCSTAAVRPAGGRDVLVPRDRGGGGGASTIWPAGLAGVGIEVDGRVALPVRVIERSRSLGLVVDTIVSGRGVWQRSAPPAGEVGDAPWGVVAEGPPALGLAELPDLLDDAVEVQVLGLRP